jgi:hypothetical protein
LQALYLFGLRGFEEFIISGYCSGVLVAIAFITLKKAGQIFLEKLP